MYKQRCFRFNAASFFLILFCGKTFLIYFFHLPTAHSTDLFILPFSPYFLVLITCSCFFSSLATDWISDFDECFIRFRQLCAFQWAYIFILIPVAHWSDTKVIKSFITFLPLFAEQPLPHINWRNSRGLLNVHRIPMYLPGKSWRSNLIWVNLEFKCGSRWVFKRRNIEQILE